MYALKCLDKYDFTTILCVNNYYQEDERIIQNEFQRIIQEQELKNSMVQITKWADNNNLVDISKLEDNGIYDCLKGRLLTQNGVFSCPFLTNDYRGRTGSDLKDFSSTVRLETDYCIACLSNKEPMFSINIS